MTRALIQRLDAFQSDEPAGAGSNTKNPLSSGSECGLSNSSLPSSENSHNMFGKIHLLSELLAEQTRDLKASVVSSSRPNSDLVSPQMISTCKELRREMLTLLRRSQTSPENFARSSESMSSDRVASTTKAKRYSRKSKKSSSSAALMENLSESDDASSVQSRASHTSVEEYNQNQICNGSKYGSNVSVADGTSPANDGKVSKYSSQTSYERVDDEAPRIPGHDLMRASPENVSSPPCSVRSSSRSSISRSSSLVSSECVQVRPPCTTRYFQKCRDNIRCARRSQGTIFLH